MSFQAKVLSLSKGGTNANLTASNGGILYSTASAAAILSGTATAGQMLQSGASTTPAWSTATYPATAGTSGNVLKSDGTNIVSSSNSGNLVLIQSQTASSASTLVFTSGITGYDNYVLTYYGVTISDDNTHMLFKCSTNGGSTYDSSNYSQIGVLAVSAALSLFDLASIDLFFAMSNAATFPGSGTMNMYNINSSSLYKNFTLTSSYQCSGTGDAYVSTSAAYQVTTAVNAFQISMSAGTFSGNFKLYGVQN